jgi:hypothetical protein
MKYVDKTPYRSETGEINIISRVQGMLKYGLSWFERVKAQDAVSAAFGRQLGGQYTLLQNVILPETDIDLPLVLLGPPGVFLINAVHERGVYVARDEEWGTISGESFAPARINQVKRTQALARVLQVYLERQGFKGIAVESILMSADPALHIDSTRPVVRVVMSDALDRFALSLAQARMVLGPDAVVELERSILVGKSQTAATAAAAPVAPPPAAGAGAAYTPPAVPRYETQAPAGDGSLDFSFSEEPAEPEVIQRSLPASASRSGAPAPAPRPRPSGTKKAPKAKKIMGLSTRQLIIVGVLALCWLCSMLAFAGYYFYSIGYLKFV